jgi:hypothetical protein
METALGAKRESSHTNAEMELTEYKNVEYTPYVREFMKRRFSRCSRCNGFMTRDGELPVACRCVQCGDVVDPTILRNRTAISMRRSRYVGPRYVRLGKGPQHQKLRGCETS